MSNFIFSRSFIPGRGPWGNKSTNTNQTGKQTPWDGLRDGTAEGARVWGDDTEMSNLKFQGDTNVV